MSEKIDPASDLLWGTQSIADRKPISKEGRVKRSAAEAYPPLDQLASLCVSHHNAKTWAEQRGEDYWRKGCDIFGRPNDPDHPWNKEKSGRSEKLGSG